MASRRVTVFGGTGFLGRRAICKMLISRFASPRGIPTEGTGVGPRTSLTETRQRSVYGCPRSRAVGAPAPQVTEEEALAAFGPDTVYYATQLHGASNEKAKRELNFRPRRLERLEPTQSNTDT